MQDPQSWRRPIFTWLIMSYQQVRRWDGYLIGSPAGPGGEAATPGQLLLARGRAHSRQPAACFSGSGRLVLLQGWMGGRLAPPGSRPALQRAKLGWDRPPHPPDTPPNHVQHLFTRWVGYLSLPRGQPDNTVWLDRGYEAIGVGFKAD